MQANTITSSNNTLSNNTPSPRYQLVQDKILTPQSGDTANLDTCSGAERMHSSIERGLSLVLEPTDDGPCRLHSDCLLSTEQEVDDLVVLLRGKDFRVSHISLNLSDRMEASVLQRLLAAVEAQHELRLLELRVNGSDTAPMPAPWREALAASYSFLVKGGALARHRLFDEAFQNLPADFQGESWHIVRMELDDFLDFSSGYGRVDALWPQRARLISGMALLMKDGVLLRAIATLSHLQTILVDEKLRYMGSSRVLSLGFVDESLSALGLNYHLQLSIDNAKNFERLMEWLSSPRERCQAITVSFSCSTPADQWAALQTALMGQASLRSVVISGGLKEVWWRVDPASGGGRAQVGLSGYQSPGQIEIETTTALLERLRPAYLTLRAERPKDIATVLACVKQPSAVSTLTFSWKQADAAFDELARQLLGFGHAVMVLDVTKSCWDRARAQWLRAIEAFRPLHGSTLLRLADVRGPGFSLPGPNKVASWENGMQYFFSQPPFHWPMELSLSRYKNAGDGLSLRDCQALTLVSQATQAQVAKFFREQRAVAIVEGLQDGRIDRLMLRQLLTDSSGQIDRELKEEVLRHLPALSDEWAPQGLTGTDH